MAMGVHCGALQSFCEWQMRIGNGTEPEVQGPDIIEVREPECLENRVVRIPDEFALSGSDPTAHIDEIFPDSESIHDVGKDAILSRRNDTQRAISSILLDRVDVPSTSSLSSDETNSDHDALIFHQQFLNTIPPAGISTHEIILKLGAPCTMLRPIKPSLGLSNRSQCVLVRTATRPLMAGVSTVSHTGTQVFVPYAMLDSQLE